MKKKSLFGVLAFLALLLCLSVSAGAATYQWKAVGNGNYRCYKNGKLVKNQWVGKRHLNASGYMDRNKWVARTANGKTKTYFVRDDGKAVVNFKAGWQKIGKKYYYYTSAGVLVKNKWITIKNDGKYYVDSTGARVTGLVKFTDGYRYFDANGRAKTGKQKINGKYYYFQSGSLLALTNGFYKIGGKIYCFDKKGVLRTGWIKRSGKWYYFKSYMGQNRWLTVKGKKYYLTASGARAEGLVTLKGKLYYFDESTGALKTNTIFIADRKRYSADKNGVCTRVSHLGTPLKAVNVACASPEAFIKKVAELCKDDWKNYKILPSMSIAQACLETGYGTSDLYIYANALYGIKATGWSGEIFRTYSPEVINGKTEYLESDFRKYNSLAESVADHGKLLQGANYKAVVGKKSFKKAVLALQAAGYATSPTYAKTLWNIYKTYNLGQYDKQ